MSCLLELQWATQIFQPRPLIKQSFRLYRYTGQLPFRTSVPSRRCCRLTVRAEKLSEKAEEASKDLKGSVSDAVKSTEKTAEEITEKYGLEAGLWNVFRGKGEKGSGKGQQAKDLLKKYGSAYLITSISFAIVSFSLCYALVGAGVDVPALLSKIGLSVSDTNEKVGTAAIAYAAHKALSPVRFPPTVALTPVVAKLLGKDKTAEENGSRK